MNKIAEVLEIHPMRVYEVATFYTMFNRQKKGKFHLQVCGTTPCMVRGSDEVFRAIKDYCGIEPGQTSNDSFFTCDEVECLAACANAPMMQINNEEVYEDLNYENTKQLLENLKNGTAKPGPQIARNCCHITHGFFVVTIITIIVVIVCSHVSLWIQKAEGPLGRTCLKDGIPPPTCRDFDKLKKDLEQQQAAQKK
ncbi:hypothetical protein RFI_00991 [Reticulomyxa filosa]|uniref:Uncharacterized protein n=1 Tax=Reticulomyxa filosa TaxID=46433 RepID=X6PDD5_RETFI|nr:hypothetical protein RFI_00991 [Reticulomyxa filosa]|eukprot:ETO36069.1 hypothetical protein RFI_00991 [Reticulomyxa filosa]